MMPAGYIDEISEFIKAVRENMMTPFPGIPTCPESMPNYTENFVNFRRKLLLERENVIIFSGSGKAVKRAFRLGVPFYSKRFDKQSIEHSIYDTSIDSQKSMDKYKFGDVKDFVIRYLT